MAIIIGGPRSFVKLAPLVTTVHIALNVNTTGQLVTAKEREFWDAELAVIEMAALGENVTTGTQASLDKAVLSAFSQNRS